MENVGASICTQSQHGRSNARVRRSTRGVRSGGSFLFDIPQKLDCSGKSNNLMYGIMESAAEFARIGSVKPQRDCLSQQRKTSINKSGQRAKVDALFANTAQHMETPWQTFTNLTVGLRPKQLSE